MKNHSNNDDIKIRVRFVMKRGSQESYGRAAVDEIFQAMYEHHDFTGATRRSLLKV